MYIFISCAALWNVLLTKVKKQKRDREIFV